MNLNPDFREFIALLNAHEVRYLVVGGYAVGMHGHPRYINDLGGDVSDMDPGPNP
jgi:2-hydroxy-3-keto-5-methylthiopentenyl-1-phosphate phosphatase